ncbi:disease resistance protein RPM1 [Prunus yedoensis var. nudiflora]|uniref:Disease resistance protein RPM1 n=1 Tax=Prunus yedoensis var. nudiflora TaxID=2094558 RepID=A0A314Y572_PRUYE|nr:disease resistance protein RPM1 [Prunus yedoensis var. nudiflora]
MDSAVIDLSIGKIGSFLESEASLLAGVHDELEEIKLELLTMKMMNFSGQKMLKRMVGMGGSGKTTLVVNTFKTQTAKFHCYAWLTVSKTFKH